MESGKKHFLKNMVGFSMMTWISFVIGFIASPIGTRLFAPDELAKINLFNTFASFFSSLCYLGLDQAYVRFYREPPGGASKAGILTFCMAASLVFSVVSSSLLCFGWRAISVQVTGAEDFGVFLCLCVFSFALVLFRYLSLIYRMEQNALLYTVQGVLYVLVTKIAYLSVGFVSAVARPAILMLTGMTGLFTLVFVCLQRKSFEPRLKATLTRPFLSEISRYAAPLIPITVITWLNSSVSQLALRNLLGFEDVGIFTSALGLASSINIIQSGFNTYWAPYVFENYHKDDKRRFFTVHRVMACALTLFGLGITVLQQPVFLLLGKSYRSAVIYFPFLFLSPICYCLSETTGMGINIAKKTYWTTIIFGLSVVANMALCYLLIPVIGAPGAAMATALSAVLSLVLRTVIGEKYYKAISNYRYVGYTIGLMSGASMLNLWLADSPLLKYVLLVLVLALACLLFRKEIGELWTLLRQILSELVRKRGAKEGQ